MSRELERLRAAAIVVADVLDAGERDPTWDESQELEEAAIAYGRAVRKTNSRSRRGSSRSSTRTAFASPPTLPARTK